MTDGTTPFERFAAAVADFGSPFYAEERQRDVWNEASAFGFQMLLWSCLVVAGTMCWVGGRPMARSATALVVIVGVVSAMTVSYARRLGVVVDNRPTRARLVVIAAVAGYVVSGLFVAGWPGSSQGGLWAAGVVGAVVGVAEVLILTRFRPAQPADDAE